MAAVERGIEAGDLGDFRMARADLPDRRQIVRLVQRGQRHKLLKTVQHRVVHQDRCCEVRPAMHDPVADRTWHAAKPPDQPRFKPAERRIQVRYLVRRVSLVDQARPASILGRQMRPGADSLQLTLERELQPVAVDEVEQLELDARRAGINDQQRFDHAGHATAAVAAARRAWA